MANFEASVRLRSTLDAVFDFLIRPANVLKISPPQVKLSLVDVPDVIELGSRLEFQIGGFGPVQHLLHEITEFDRPNRFTERQVKGPMSSFLHEHLLEADEDGEVLVIDRIEFEPPGGMVGFLVTEERIIKSMKASFEHRHRELKRLLELPER